MQLSFGLHSVKIPLAQHLVSGDSHRVGEIERAQRGQHGDTHAAVGVCEQQLLGESARLRAEHQIYIALIVHVGVTRTCFGGVIIDFGVGMRSEELIGVCIVAYVELVPVIQSRAAQMLVL